MSCRPILVIAILFTSVLVASGDQPRASKKGSPAKTIIYGVAKGEGVVCLMPIGMQTIYVPVEVEQDGKKVTIQVPHSDCVTLPYLVTVDGKEVQAFGTDGQPIPPQDLPKKLATLAPVVLLYDVELAPRDLQDFQKGTVILVGPKSKVGPPPQPKK